MIGRLAYDLAKGAAMASDPFSQDRLVLRRKFFKIFGETVHLLDESETPLLYASMKAFRLKEDIRIYADETMTEPVLTITSPHVIDFSAGYDVYDPRSEEKVGGLRRRGFKSLMRDEWAIVDTADAEVGVIREDSAVKALVRRFVEAAALFLPQQYHAEMEGASVATFRQHFNPFVFRLTADFSADEAGRLDRRLGIAAALLLSVIEGREG